MLGLTRVCVCVSTPGLCLLSHAEAATVEACLQSVYPYGKEKETDSRPPPTITYPTPKLSILPSQERREDNRDARVAVICVHKHTIDNQ